MNLDISPDQPFVPVLTGGDVGAYSLAREFHQAYGVKSVIISTYPNRVVGGSAIAQVIPMGPMYDPDKVMEQFIGVAQAARAETDRPLVLVPGYDHVVRIMIENRDQLADHGYLLPELSLEQFDRAALKENFYQICDELGVKYPKTVLFDAAGGTTAADAVLDTLAGDDWSFPLILKADDGGTWANFNFPGRRKVHYLQNRAEVQDLLAKIVDGNYSDKLIIQEFIPGADHQLQILTQFRSREGTVVLSGLAEVVVEDHAPGLEGNSRVLVVNPQADIEQTGKRLLDALDWHGFGMFDIKIHEQTGEAYFLEMNPRMGRHHFYLTAAGANPAEYIIREFLEHAAHPPARSLQPPAVSTTLPWRLAKKYASATQRPLLEAARRARQVYWPLDYPADRSLQRSAYLLYRNLRSAQEVAHTPGTMNG